MKKYLFTTVIDKHTPDLSRALHDKVITESELLSFLKEIKKQAVDNKYIRYSLNLMK